MTETIKINGEEKPVSASTEFELLQAEEIDPAARFVAVAINGSVVPRRSWPEATIRPGDDVEIVRPAPGG